MQPIAMRSMTFMIEAARPNWILADGSLFSATSNFYLLLASLPFSFLPGRSFSRMLFSILRQPSNVLLNWL